MIIWITPTHSVRSCFLCFSCFFFHTSAACSGALTANHLRLAPSEQNCQVCSRCICACVFACANLTHPFLVLLPLQTGPDNQMKYACSAIFTLSQQWPSADAPKEKFCSICTFSTVNARARQFWNKLAYSNNLGWEIRSNRDIPCTKDSTLLSL